MRLTFQKTPAIYVLQSPVEIFQTFVSNFVHNLFIEKTRSCIWQIKYGNLLCATVQLDTDLNACSHSHFVKYGEPYERCLSNHHFLMDPQKSYILKVHKEPSIFVSSPSQNPIYTAMKPNLWAQYSGTYLQSVQDFFIT